MLKKLLKRFGFIHESEITEEFLGERYGKLLGDVTDYEVSPKEETEFFKDLSRVEGVSEYLKATAAKDLQRYFSAPDEKQRDVIRGAFARTTYLKSRLSKANREAVEDATKLDGLRYG